MVDYSKLPLRKITVLVGDSVPMFQHEGHAVQSVDGALSILRYVRSTLYTVKTYASGYWQSVELEPPTEQQLADIDAVSAAEEAELQKTAELRQRLADAPVGKRAN